MQSKEGGGFTKYYQSMPLSVGARRAVPCINERRRNVRMQLCAKIPHHAYCRLSVCNPPIVRRYGMRQEDAIFAAEVGEQEFEQEGVLEYAAGEYDGAQSRLVCEALDEVAGRGGNRQMKVECALVALVVRKALRPVREDPKRRQEVDRERLSPLHRRRDALVRIPLVHAVEQDPPARWR